MPSGRTDSDHQLTPSAILDPSHPPEARVHLFDREPVRFHRVDILAKREPPCESCHVVVCASTKRVLPTELGEPRTPPWKGFEVWACTQSRRRALADEYVARQHRSDAVETGGNPPGQKVTNHLALAGRE